MLGLAVSCFDRLDIAANRPTAARGLPLSFRNRDLIRPHDTNAEPAYVLGDESPIVNAARGRPRPLPGRFHALLILSRFLPRLAAGLAPLRGRQPLGGEELLFSFAEHEVRLAVRAADGLIRHFLPPKTEHYRPGTPGTALASEGSRTRCGDVPLPSGSSPARIGDRGAQDRPRVLSWKAPACSESLSLNLLPRPNLTVRAHGNQSIALSLAHSSARSEALLRASTLPASVQWPLTRL